MDQSSRVSGACPSFFRACIREARRGGYNNSYAMAAYQLTGAAHGLVDDDESDPDSVVDALYDAAEESAEAVVEWMKVHLPRCMALVPRRRLPSFTRGVERAIEDDRLG